MRSNSTLFVSLALLTLFACENNIGRAFDPDGVGGGGSGSGDTSNIQALPIGGKAVDGRPSVVDAFPKAAGWPVSVPVVVLFDESMNEQSVLPLASSGLPPTVFLRQEMTDVALAADYDFLLGGTVVMIRPLIPLLDMTVYEVVVGSEARDTDGVRVGGDERVVATFTVDEDLSEADGRIVTTLPLANASGRLRESPVYVVFDKPATIASVTSSNFFMQTSSAVSITGTLSFPLNDIGGNADGRVLRFDPDTVFAANTDQEIIVDETIAFPGTPPGQLDFNNRTPFASFATQDVEPPLAVAVNVSPGFPDKINIQNIDNLMVDVDLPASTLAGDLVIVRIYGLDPLTGDPADVNFVERSNSVVAAGAQTLSVDLTAALGSALAPRFSDGAVTIIAQQGRGARRSGSIHSNPGNAPSLDVTLPSLVTFGPPTGPLAGDMVTDLQQIALYGTASEQLAGATLTAMAPVSNTTNMFASSADGRFMMRPLLLGRLTVAVSASLELTDLAGNVTSVMPIGGTIQQRGVVTGSVGAGMSLTVEAYDESTLEALAGVSVIIEPGLPSPTGAGQITMTTGMNGRVTFTGLTAPSYSVTLVQAGFELISLLDTPAGQVSLPMRPLSAATASLGGNLLFPPISGQTALVGINVLDDVTVEAVATSSTAPTTLPNTAIRPNRPIVISAYSGVVEPTSLPAFNNFACQMCGPLGLTRTPPAPPVDSGQTGMENLPLIPAAVSIVNLASSFTVDFANSLGLGTISGSPTVRIVGSLFGISGMPLMGVGFATLSAGKAYTVDGSLSLSTFLGLGPFLPVLWVSTEARDGAGNIARHRRAVSVPATGTTLMTTLSPGVPTINPPAGPATGSPAVSFEDRLEPATALAVGGFGFHQLRATDPNGRRWTLLVEDQDGIASKSLQFPQIQSPLVGLGTGTWSVSAETFLVFSSTFANADYILEERFRQMVTYARAVSVDFTVQ